MAQTVAQGPFNWAFGGLSGISRAQGAGCTDKPEYSGYRVGVRFMA